MERITSRANPLAKHIRALARSADARRGCRAYVAEGDKLLREALRHNVPIQAVIWREPAGDAVPSVPPHIRVAAVPADVFDSLTPTPAPPDVLFVCEMPDLAIPETFPPGRYVILDRLQDPGNVGTILRSCAAFGGSVILCDGCADPYSPKAVRAAMGALFHVPLYRGGDESVRRSLGDIPLYAADADKSARCVTDTPLNPAAVVIGQEGGGVSDFWRKQGEGLSIPMEAGCESLNAAMAAAIVLWEGYAGRAAPGAPRRSEDRPCPY
jgi:TrmH family RNA methyltransferase